MKDTGQRKSAIDQIRQNIVQRGFHTYVVTGGGDPHYAYTIGLRDSLGAELIIAGAYFYKLEEIPQIIDKIVAGLSPETDLKTREIIVDSRGSFSFREVDESWVKKLMLGALDFYQIETMKAWQIVPDESHFTLDIPNMNKPWSAALFPVWRDLDQEWAYPIPVQSIAITNLGALRGERVTEVMRWENDEWEMFAGASPNVPADERRVVPISILLAVDNSLYPAVYLEIGAGLWRDDVSEWNPWGTTAQQ
ncbi:MAG: DUF4262 domain-containing protein [Acidobacteria bacterium]|nr:DUF4262 domain-containing protein [Acidobacteriota bacterium]